MKDIYYIPHTNTKEIVIFSPLRKVAYLTQEDDFNNQKHLQALLEESDANPIEPEDDTLSFNNNNLILLLTNKCNFSCRYCYSQFSRSNETLDKSKLITILNYVLSNPKNTIKRITFAGGGEPLVEWDLLVWAVQYIYSCVDKSKVHLAIVTNGSLLSESRIRWLINNNVQINISFDILPEIQNTQRPLKGQSSFNRVDEALQTLYTLKYPIALRTTITEDYVDKIKDMVEFVHQRYENVNNINIWPEIIVRETEQHSSTYYQDYIKNFIDALELSQKYGIRLSNWLTIFNKVHSRFCQEDFTISATGNLSACLRAASSSDPFFDYFSFGKVTDNKVAIDKERVKSVMQLLNNKHNACKTCFAKWSCAGLCPNTRLLLQKKGGLDNYCTFTRSFITEYLYWMLKRNNGYIKFDYEQVLRQ